MAKPIPVTQLRCREGASDRFAGWLLRAMVDGVAALSPGHGPPLARVPAPRRAPRVATVSKRSPRWIVRCTAGLIHPIVSMISRCCAARLGLFQFQIGL